MALKDDQPVPQTETPNGANPAYTSPSRPSSLLRSDGVGQLRHTPNHQPRLFTDWAAI